MHMNTKLLLAVLIGFVVGAGAVILFDKKEGEMKEGVHRMSNGMMMQNDATTGMHGTMNNMTAGLSGKTGDEFDTAFLSEMIVHHQGAVDMAHAALKNAKHIEIKNMAEAIIAAQTKEITQMQEWQKSWYGGQ